MTFVGLSNPIKHRNQQLTGADREKDSYENYHPAINYIYIDWVIKQLKLNNELQIPNKNKESDWTEGAALDIIINGKQPKAFNNN